MQRNPLFAAVLGSMLCLMPSGPAHPQTARVAPATFDAPLNHRVSVTSTTWPGDGTKIV